MVMTPAERILRDRETARRWRERHPGYHIGQYRRNPEAAKRAVRGYRARGREFALKAIKRAFIDSLKAGGCVDCGNKNLTVLHFDHLSDKVIALGNMRMRSFIAIEREAAKCEVVCANCHMIRTRRRDLEAWAG